MSKKLKVLFYLGKLEMNTKQILFYAIRMYCTRIENIISYHKRTMVKSINWLTKNSSERIWHTALILSGGGSLQSALKLNTLWSYDKKYIAKTIQSSAQHLA